MNPVQHEYIHSERGKAAQKRYSESEKGKARDGRKYRKRIETGKNAEYCRRYYERHREEILRKKREKRAKIENAERKEAV